MGIFNRKPRVKAMARARDVNGLVAATRYREISPVQDGTRIDLGARTRVAALYALRDLGPAAGEEAVAGALTDPEDRVRTAAIAVLFERAQPDPIADALQWLPSKGGSRYLAFQALLQQQARGSAARVAEALVLQVREEPLDEDDLTAFGELLGDEPAAARAKVTEFLAAAIRHEDDFVATRAVQLLVRLGPESVEALVEALPDPEAGHHAAVGLAELKDARSLEPLIRTLHHPDARARAASCAALGELRDSTAVEPLLSATQDPELVVRSRAGAALDQLGTIAVVVGISAILRPEIESALESGPRSAPELEAETPHPAPANGRTSTNATTLERVARLLEGLGTAGQSGVY